MKVLFQLNHPAHYHLVKNAIKNLKMAGHEVHILARGKDVLKDLLIGETYTMLPTGKGSNIFKKIVKMRKVKEEILSFSINYKTILLLERALSAILLGN